MPRTGGVLSTTEAGNTPRQNLTENSPTSQNEVGQAKTKAAGGDLTAELQRQAAEGHPTTGKTQDQEAAKKPDQGKTGQKDQGGMSKNQQPEQNNDQKQQQKTNEKQEPPPAKKNNQPDETTLSSAYQPAESKDQGKKVERVWTPGASNETSTKETTWGRILRQGQEQGEVELRVKPTDRIPGTRRSFGENRKDDDSLWGVDSARDEERGNSGGLRGFASQKWGELTGGRQGQNQSVWGMSRNELLDHPNNQQRDEFSGRNLRREFSEYDRFKADDSDWRRSNFGNSNDRFRTSDRDEDDRSFRNERRFRDRDEDDKGTWEKIKEKGQEWKEDAKEWVDDKLSTNRDDDGQFGRDGQFRNDRFKNKESDWRRNRGVEDRLNRVEDRRDRDERRFNRFDRGEQRQFRDRDEDDKGTWEKIKEKGQEWKEDAKEWVDDKLGSRQNDDRRIQIRSSDRFYDQTDEVEDITAGAPVRRTSLQPLVEDWKEHQRGKAEEWKDWSQDKSQELKGYAKDKRDEWRRDAKGWKQDHFPSHPESTYLRQRDEDDRSFRNERRFRDRDEDDKGTWEKIKEKGQEWKEDAKEWVDDKLGSSDSQSNSPSQFYRDDIRAGAPVERASFSSWMDQQQEHARNWEKMKESGVMFREPEFKLQESRFRLTERHDPTTERSSSAEEALTDHTDAFVEDGFLGLREVEGAEELEANAQSGSGVRSFFAGKWFDFTHDKHTVDKKYDDLRNRRDVQDWQQRTFEQRGRGTSQNDREKFNNFKSRFGESNNNEQSFNSRFSSPSRMPVEDRLGYHAFNERRGEWNANRSDENQNERRFTRSPLRNEERRGLYSWEQRPDSFGPKADFMSDAEYRTWDRYRLKLANALTDRNAQVESDADLTGLMEDTKVRDDDWHNRRDQERKNEKKGWFGFGKDHSKREEKSNAQEEAKPLDISSWFKNTDENDNRSSR